MNESQAAEQIMREAINNSGSWWSQKSDELYSIQELQAIADRHGLNVRHGIYAWNEPAPDISQLVTEDAKKRLTAILSGEKDPLHPHDTVDKVLIDVYHAGFRNALKVIAEEKHHNQPGSPS